MTHDTNLTTTITYTKNREPCNMPDENVIITVYKRLVCAMGKSTC
jgi:hypothetical protein